MPSPSRFLETCFEPFGDPRSAINTFRRMTAKPSVVKHHRYQPWIPEPDGQKYMLLRLCKMLRPIPLLHEDSSPCQKFAPHERRTEGLPSHTSPFSHPDGAVERRAPAGSWHAHVGDSVATVLVEIDNCQGVPEQAPAVWK